MFNAHLSTPMLDTLSSNLYDHPKYYDLVYGSDWKAEYDFLRGCFTKHAEGDVHRVFEPACGTGRLMIRLARAGLQVAGLDLNSCMVDYCNARLARHGFPATALVGDMAKFQLAEPVDAAFCMINSFRHLTTEEAARDHLACVARALRPGGIYVLGLHLTPTEGEPIGEESWSARRGHLAVISSLWSIDLDLSERRETVGMSYDIYTPSRTFRLQGTTDFRTYTMEQMEELLREVPDFCLSGTYDFSYRIEEPACVTPATEDIVYVLAKL